MGGVRKLWREHLSIDDDQLKIFARTLAESPSSESLEDLRERLDLLFAYVGLCRVPASDSAFIYDEVVFQWLGQRRVMFDRDDLRAVLLEHAARRSVVACTRAPSFRMWKCAVAEG
jgi:hypothetical protein